MPKKKNIDLAAISPSRAAQKGFKVQLTHPTQGALDAWITVQGSESPAYRAFVNSKQNEILQREFAAETQEDYKPEPATVEKTIEGASALLAAVTVAWEGIAYDGEDPFECTPENAQRLYAAEAWIRKQVDKAVHNIGNFTSG